MINLQIGKKYKTKNGAVIIVTERLKNGERFTADLAERFSHYEKGRRVSDNYTRNGQLYYNSMSNWNVGSEFSNTNEYLLEE